MDWVRQEPGWYTNEEFGGICREGSTRIGGAGWYLYPAISCDCDYLVSYPFKTLRQAKHAATELIAHANQEVHDLSEGDAMA